MRKQLLVALLASTALLALVAEYLVHGEAATVHALFYIAVLGLIIGVLRVLLPRGPKRRTAPRRR